MENKSKSLREIVKGTIWVGIIFPPLYSGLTALTGSETFLEKLTDKNTLYLTLGGMTVKALYGVGEKVYQSMRKK